MIPNGELSLGKTTFADNFKVDEKLTKSSLLFPSVVFEGETVYQALQSSSHQGNRSIRYNEKSQGVGYVYDSSVRNRESLILSGTVLRGIVVDYDAELHRIIKEKKMVSEYVSN